MKRRALFAAPLLLAAPALAQPAFPAGRPTRIVVPFPAGGSTDVITRILAEALRAAWGAPVVVENRPGAGGNIGAEAVARGAPDGSELLMGSVSFATNARIMRNLTFDPLRDFAPVSLVSTVPNALLVRRDLPAADVPGLIALAKAQPEQLTYGSAGIGTSAHLAAAQFEQMAGVRMVHVPYRGTGPALTDLAAGRLDLMFDIITAALNQIQAGQVRALAVTSPGPSPVIPGLPPLATVLPGFEAETWNGLYVPARTPAAIVAQISADVDRALHQPEVMAALARVGVTPLGGAPGVLAAQLHRETEKWGRVVEAGGIRAE